MSEYRTMGFGSYDHSDSQYDNRYNSSNDEKEFSQNAENDNSVLDNSGDWGQNYNNNYKNNDYDYSESENSFEESGENGYENDYDYEENQQFETESSVDTQSSLGENEMEQNNNSNDVKITEKQIGKANIVVAGIGGGGNNAVNNMIRHGVDTADFIVMNTDMQALNMSRVPSKCKIQLGEKITSGLGAGSIPNTGKLSAEESKEKIKNALEGIDLLFLTGGMGGGTGTGAMPVVAEVAKSLGILTVAVVTKPFEFEGKIRMQNAEYGINELKKFVDTLLIIPNEKLIEVLPAEITFLQAFEEADDVLRQAIQGVADVIVRPETINLDFADVSTILKKRGFAHMGIGVGKGENRVLEAVQKAVQSPLLETNIQGATGIIINIRGGSDMKLKEVTDACRLIREVVDPHANIIFGSAVDKNLQDFEVTIIATGFQGRQGNAFDEEDNILNSEPVQSSYAEKHEPAHTSEVEMPVRPQFSASTVTAPVVEEKEEEIEQVEEHIQPKIVTSRIETPSRELPKFLGYLNRNKKGRE